MPVLKPTKTLPKFAITDETVTEWLENELDGSPIVPTKELARECALAILNAQREEEKLEPLVRCPKEMAETALSYIEDYARDQKAEDADESDDEPSEGQDEPEDDEEGEEGGKSIVKRVYKTKYRPHHMTCGDELSGLISAHVIDKDNEDGEPRVNRERLVRFAKLNGCWDERYVRLNVGQVRMNVGNRLRAKVRKGHEIIWG